MTLDLNLTVEKVILGGISRDQSWCQWSVTWPLRGVFNKLEFSLILTSPDIINWRYYKWLGHLKRFKLTFLSNIERSFIDVILRPKRDMAKLEVILMSGWEPTSLFKKYDSSWQQHWDRVKPQTLHRALAHGGEILRLFPFTGMLSEEPRVFLICVDGNLLWIHFKVELIKAYRIVHSDCISCLWALTSFKSASCTIQSVDGIASHPKGTRSLALAVKSCEIVCWLWTCLEQELKSSFARSLDTTFKTYQKISASLTCWSSAGLCYWLG